MANQRSLFEAADLIDAYSRAQAIEDGVLVDVTESSERRESGIRFPIALTRAVWDRYVEVPQGVRFQDVHGRLWAILWMLSLAIRKSAGGSALTFQLYVRNDNRRPKLVTLKALCGPGDDLEPTITVMLPEED